MIATGRAQADLNAMLAHYAALYEVVVRLKGGDPYVFGRGGEEAFALLNAGHHVEVVPGLSSALAAPAAAGIPLTHRGRSHGFTVVTAASAHDVAGVDWFGIARLDHTLVVLMGVRLAPHIATALIAGGRSPDEPVAVIGSATTACQQVERTTLARLAQVRVPAPATIVIGDVAGFEGLPVWQGDHLTTHHGTAHKGTAHHSTAHNDAFGGTDRLCLRTCPPRRHHHGTVPRPRRRPVRPGGKHAADESSEPRLPRPARASTARPLPSAR